MTNFKPFKDKIWETARDGDKSEFDRACEDLMKKAVEDLFRVGWNIYPQKIEDVYELLDNVAEWSHERWQEAMKCGDAPYEDVSPGEGYLLVKRVIQQAIEGKAKGKTGNGKVD